MSGTLIAFYLLALVAIASAVGMLLNKNAIYSALFLILNFATVAVFYLILGAPFIALAQITVYAGAIMVLFLFVIMLLGAEKLAGEDKLTWQRPLSYILTAVLLVDAFYLIFIGNNVPVSVNSFVAGFGDPKSIGLELFQQYLLPFEVTSVLLLVAMIGAIVLTKRDKKSGPAE